MDTILVTGAAGTVGRHVMAGLTAAGADAVAADTGTDPRFDFTDPATWHVFDGIGTMFLLRPPALSNIERDMVPALRAAQSAGVRHVVLLSVQGAEGNRFVPHAEIEAWLRGSGMSWTFVRPSFFMENLSGTHATDIAERDEILLPAGRGRTAFVAATDVAAVAVAALLDPAAHHNTAWTPTGEEALTYGEVAGILSQELGRPIAYRSVGLPRYALHARRALHMPWGMVGVTCGIYTVARMGRSGGLTDDVRTVTGRAPLTMRDWVHRNRAAWQR